MTVSGELPIVAAILSEAGTDRLRRFLRKRARLFVASRWDDLLGIVRRQTASVVFADPLSSGMGSPANSLRRLRAGAGVPLILYTQLTPQSAGILLELGHSGIRHVVFVNFDDRPQRLLAVL